MRPIRVMQARGAAGGGAPVYAKWNAADKSSLIVLSNSDKTAHRSGTGTAVGAPFATVRATLGKSSGKWYFEISSPLNDLTANGEESGGLMTAAVNLADVTTSAPYTGVSTPSYGHCYRRGGGAALAVQELRNGSGRFVGTGAYRANDGYMGVAVDLDAGKAWAIINGAWTFGQSPVSTPAGTWTFTPGITLFPAICIQSGIATRTEATHTLNAGDATFQNIAATAFDPGQVLAGFNPGWY